jgi:cell division septum initiation protein DivIVA
MRMKTSLGEAPQYPHQRAVAIGHDIIRDMQRQRARQSAARSVDAIAKAVEVGIELLDRRAHLRPFRRQGKAAAPAGAQRHAQALFEGRDIRADRGLALAEADFGGREAALCGDGAEDTQQSQVGLGDLAAKESVRHRRLSAGIDADEAPP